MPMLTRNDLQTLNTLFAHNEITYHEIPEKYHYLMHNPVAEKHKNKLLQFHPVYQQFFYKGNALMNGKMKTCMVIL
jgi:hypothetical protein